MPMSGDLARPTLECWTVLSAFAARVPRLAIGSLVCGNTYRHPYVLAKMAATVDQISGGRLVLGLGSGWQENEHLAYGWEFPSIRERLGRLDEACHVVRSLFENERSNFQGRYYALHDAVLEPKPVQPRLPLMIGGGGERVTLRIAARHADLWNCWGTPERIREKVAILDRHCAELGRPPAEIVRTAVALFHLDDDADRAARFARDCGRPCIAGNAEVVRAALREYESMGVGEVIVPDFNLGSGAKRIAAIDRLMHEVIRA
jgi:alkanesulfonate monooxygenase SsuD/methylene tetrahydromethanopterin reductase-like flavin-dependent oxidoreductase (luciferase family)